MEKKEKEWLPLSVTFFLEKDDKILLTTETRFVKRTDLIKQFKIHSDLINELVKNNQLSRYLSQQIEYHQKKEFEFSDAELAALVLPRPVFEMVYKKFKAIDLSDIKNQSLFESNQVKKYYFGFKSCQLTSSRPIDQGYYKIRILSSQHIYLRTYTSRLKGASKQVMVEADLVQHRLDTVRCKEQWHVFDYQRTDATKEEGEILKKLQGKEDIVRCFQIHHKEGCSEASNHCSYLMEYCNGGSFSQCYLSLNEQERDQVLKDSLIGLSHVHALKYLHLDLHFGNILIKKTDSSLAGKLIDFGNARRIDKMTETEYFIENLIDNKAWTANPSVFSPEMLMQLLKCRAEKIGKHFLMDPTYSISSKSDIWQLGLNLATFFYQIDIKKFKFTSKLPPYLYFLKCVNKYYNYFLEFDKMPLHVIRKIIPIYCKDSPSPQNKESMDYLIWWMLRPNPDDRPSALECVEFINKKLLKNQPTQISNSKEEILID